MEPIAAPVIHETKTPRGMLPSAAVHWSKDEDHKVMYADNEITVLGAVKAPVRIGDPPTGWHYHNKDTIYVSLSTFTATDEKPQPVGRQITTKKAGDVFSYVQRGKPDLVHRMLDNKVHLAFIGVEISSLPLNKNVQRASIGPVDNESFATAQHVIVLPQKPHKITRTSSGTMPIRTIVVPTEPGRMDQINIDFGCTSKVYKKNILRHGLTIAVAIIEYNVSCSTNFLESRLVNSGLQKWNGIVIDVWGLPTPKNEELPQK